MKLTYYKNLDGLRGIAALMVVVFHFYSYPDGYYSGASLLKKASEIGQHGVSLFFVLSGFVITRILIQAKQEEQYFYRFYVKRILRIAPLYYLFLLFWFYVLPYMIRYPLTEVTGQLPYYFYLQNIYSTFRIPLTGPPHFWSLAVEEHFYLFWPFVVFYTPVRKLGLVIALSLVAIFVLKVGMVRNGYPIHDFTLTRMDQILMGAFLARLELKGLFRPESLRLFVKAALMIIPLACVGYVMGTQFFFLKEISKYFLLGLSFSALIGIVLSSRDDSPLNRFLGSPALQYLGQISYGIYVWHVAALIFLQHFLLTKIMALDMAIALAMTTLMAHYSYFYFESFFIRLKRYADEPAALKTHWPRLLLSLRTIFYGTSK